MEISVIIARDRNVALTFVFISTTVNSQKSEVKWNNAISTPKNIFVILFSSEILSRIESLIQNLLLRIVRRSFIIYLNRFLSLNKSILLKKDANWV